MCAIYIKPVILFLTFAICFSSLFIGMRLEAALWREERVLKGVKKYVLLRYRGRGGNRGKLVSVFEGGSKYYI